MKYMQYGGMQNHPLMRLTLYFTLFFLFGFWVTNFAMYFVKMNITPHSVAEYYLGSETEFRLPRTYQSMLEVTHAHLPMMALVMLVLTHLLIFTSFQHRTKIAFIALAFLSAFLHETAGWLVRFVNPLFAWMKVATFIIMQGTLAFIMATLVLFFIQGKAEKGKLNKHSNGENKTKQLWEGIE